jgi:drug/metabolite transporter (DMT)-like permease
MTTTTTLHRQPRSVHATANDTVTDPTDTAAHGGDDVPPPTGGTARAGAQRAGALLMIASAAAWALGLIVSKEALHRTGGAPVLVLAGQLTASVVALVVVCAARRLPVRPSLRDGWSGLLEPGVSYQLALGGLALTSAASATVIASMEPVIVPVLAWIVLHDKLRARLVATSAAATVGAVIVSIAGASAAGHSVAGDALILASVVAAAMYVVASAAAVDRNPPLSLALAQQLWALTLTLAVAAAYLTAGGSPGERLSIGSALVIAVSGILNYALPFGLYLAALTRIDVAKAAQYLTLIPVFGVVGAVGFLGESVSVAALAGTVVIVASLAVATRSTRDDATDAPAER